MSINEIQIISNDPQFEKYNHSVDGVEIFVDAGNLQVYAFLKNRKTRAWRYRFKDAYEMVFYIDDYLCTQYQAQLKKQKEKIENQRKEEETLAAIKEGTLFVTQVGSVVDFFQVTERVSKRRVKVRPIKKGFKKGDDKNYDELFPLSNDFDGDELTFSLNKHGCIVDVFKYDDQPVNGWKINKNDKIKVHWG